MTENDPLRQDRHSVLLHERTDRWVTVHEFGTGQVWDIYIEPGLHDPGDGREAQRVVRFDVPQDSDKSLSRRVMGGSSVFGVKDLRRALALLEGEDD